MSENKEITKSTFNALADTSAFKEAMDECQGMEFTPDKVRIPAGGGSAFELPGDGEESELVKDITGVIISSHPVNAYFKEKYTGGNNPPECGSFDGIHGHGCPGGMCAECQFNAFGSGEGKSKACKNRRMLYILREGELFPIMLALPTSSLKEFSQYAKRQLSKGRKISGLVTRISLRKATNSTGITYSQAVFTMVRSLTEDEKQAILPVIEQIKEYTANLTTSVISQLIEPVPDPESGEIVKPLV